MTSRVDVVRQTKTMRKQTRSQPKLSWSKWDRDAYIERVGGPEEAERRRKALMARQSGHRLAEERKQRGLTQAQLAQTMGVTRAGSRRSNAASCQPSRPSPATSRRSAGTWSSSPTSPTTPSR
jgi:ribosome-binding protein aMBF1 (putative translation factor)